MVIASCSNLTTVITTNISRGPIASTGLFSSILANQRNLTFRSLPLFLTFWADPGANGIELALKFPLI